VKLKKDLEKKSSGMEWKEITGSSMDRARAERLLEREIDRHSASIR
jgi:hypothetical protein